MSGGTLTRADERGTRWRMRRPGGGEHLGTPGVQRPSRVPRKAPSLATSRESQLVSSFRLEGSSVNSMQPRVVMNTTSMWSAILVATVLAPNGLSQCQKQKLLASDAQPSDNLGRAVAISGNWVAVGVPNVSAVPSGSGAVYIFQQVGTSWVQSQKLKASDASFGAGFGSSVAMAGDVLVIGAPQDSP